MRTYIEPNIKVIDGVHTDIAFYAWLKSREFILKSSEGVPVEIINDDVNNLPEEIIVGKEKVKVPEYQKRIINMNLQYNNLPYYVFEIDGSCLFRDLLFNINKTGAWAVSNRFHYSVLDSKQVLDESNYCISGEYKGIPEWESQFDNYMAKIKSTQVTDENRVEMPYSISSKFWWGANYKTIISLVSMLKLKMPFFYEIYGKKFLKVLRISESELKPFIDSSLQQYFRSDTWESGYIQKIRDIYVMDIEISYVILSQFLRQGDVIISGLYNDLSHEDPEEFKHKVFKGDTVCNINYTAHKSRVLMTVSKRCCNFAANSGDGPGSWAHFLNIFLKSVNSPDELRSILPCKFGKDGLLKECPLWDDVKFRNEGLESRNCVCPLTTCNLQDAVAKRDRDKNKLGNLFYDLTNEMIENGGTKYVHKLNRK